MIGHLHVHINSTIWEKSNAVRIIPIIINRRMQKPAAMWWVQPRTIPTARLRSSWSKVRFPCSKFGSLCSKVQKLEICLRSDVPGAIKPWLGGDASGFRDTLLFLRWETSTMKSLQGFQQLAKIFILFHISPTGDAKIWKSYLKLSIIMFLHENSIMRIMIY